jgi:O-antigen/teichoic acid export membrane protein
MISADSDRVQPVGGKKEDSLRKRYIFKVLSNVIGLFIGLGTQAIIPRGLGPKAYGDFSFLTSFFNEVAAFLDMGTSIGFYTKLSQRPDDRGLVAFYFRFCIVVSLFLILFAVVAGLTPGGPFLWPGQEMRYILLASIWGALTWFSQIASKMADAYGITVSAELFKIVQKVFAFALVGGMFAAGVLNLFTFFWYHYAILLFLLAGYAMILERNNHSLHGGWRLTREELHRYASEFYHYSHPLFVYALVGLIIGVMDRWLLQRFAGSIQQGYFGLSTQVSTICLLFTGAMTPLLMREFSLAFSKRDEKELARLFKRYLPVFFSVASLVSCFVVTHADMVVGLFGGAAYSNATLPMAIMALYPVHQTYGQLSGSVFYATNQTSLYRNLGIIFMVAGLPVTYCFLAPAGSFGFGLGAVGLAAKMVLVQFIAVNVLLFYNTRFMRVKFYPFLAHQVLNIVMLLVVSASSRYLTGWMMPFSGRLSGFIVSGVLYLVLAMGICMAIPWLFGVTRDDLSTMSRRFLNMRSN